MSKYQIIVGIDCGVNTGFAILNNRTRNFTVKTVMIHQALKTVTTMSDDLTIGEMLIRIEDARLRKWIPQEKNLRARVGRAKGAGSVSRDAKIWQDFCEDHGIDYELVPPKDNRTKLTAAAFAAITGYKGKTSEHARDAGMLCFKYEPKCTT
jgi:hypothetical protein